MASDAWKIASRPPHDFYLCLDVESYFDYEHDPVRMADEGYSRVFSLPDGRDVASTAWFNGDVLNPVFTIRTHEMLSEAERTWVDGLWRRILGTDLDLSGLYDQAGQDRVLSPLLTSLYGLKRLVRASLFEDTVNRIIQTQILHKPTARRMVFSVRQTYASRLETSRGVLTGWPLPSRLAQADPVLMKKHGLSARKGEYLTGWAQWLCNDGAGGAKSLQQLEEMEPERLYELLVSIRGIGPTTAQDLIHFRNRTDGFFASNFQKSVQHAVRRWILLSYGEDPDSRNEQLFESLVASWKGYEAAALEFLYVDWVLSEKRKRSIQQGM